MPLATEGVPPRPEFIPFTVPYLCTLLPWDHKEFWTFPERCGWVVLAKDIPCHILCPPEVCLRGLASEDNENQGRVPREPMFRLVNSQPVSASSKAAFLQSWLFFGGLAEISELCGLETNVKEEAVREDGSISTAWLNGLPGRWFEACLKTRRAGDKAVMEKILKVARHCHLMLSEELVDYAVPMFKYTYDECRVFQSVDIMIRIIGLHLLLHVYMPGFETTEEEGWYHGRVLHSLDWSGRYCEGMDQLTRLTGDDLEDQGWCESELDLYADHAPYLSLLTRPRMRDHSDCDSIVCNAYQTDENTYRTLHVEQGCECDFIGVGNDALVDVLAAGKIPKLVISVELDIRVESEDSYPYVALSHVWADGLGNPASNALPQCQLQRLRCYVSAAHRIQNPDASSTLPVAFWMDTLCVPVHSSAKALRKKAIQLLGKTFHEASAVLVLDRELEIVQSNKASFLELGLRILCSGWMKRLWTLQEATLASEALGGDKLYFQMQDGPFLYQKYDRDRKASHPSWTLVKGVAKSATEIVADERVLLLEDDVMLELGTVIPSVREMRDLREGWSPFRAVYYAIERRSTSRPEDVPLCVASLLGKDLAIIASTSNAEERMAKFYILMRKIPLGVLWDSNPAQKPKVLKMSLKPFRWAPMVITSFPHTAYIRWEDGVCDEHGLHFQARGVVFSTSDTVGGVGTLPENLDVVSESLNTVTQWKLAHLCPHKLRMSRAVPIPASSRMALLRRPFRRYDDYARDNVLVVSIENEVTGVDSAELTCKIVGYRREPFDEDPTEHEHSTEAVYRGSITSMYQKWCIT